MRNFMSFFLMRTALFCFATAMMIFNAHAQSQAIFSHEDQRHLSRVNVFFNTLKTLEGEFIQIDPRGREASGRFYIARPGSMRFQYEIPQSSAVVADGNWVAVQDSNGKFIDRYPLISTPLRFLLQDKVSLDKDARIEAILSSEHTLSITLSSQNVATLGKLTLNFALPHYELASWDVVDTQGNITRVAVGGLIYGNEYDETFFRIVENRVFDINKGDFE